MRLPHLVHRDPHWQQRGVFAYYQCRCGARRIRWINPSLYGPSEPGWPELRDRHGRDVSDSGWRRAAGSGAVGAGGGDSNSVSQAALARPPRRPRHRYGVTGG